MRIKYIIGFFCILLLDCFVIKTLAKPMENGLNVEYSIVDSNSIRSSFFGDKTFKISENDSYIIGYISQNLPVKYDISCKLYFYNPGKIGLKRTVNIDWVSTGKFFLLKLGPKSLYSTDVVYDIEITMRK